MNNKIQQEVDKTLLLLENNEDIKVNPYFYSRLTARLNEVLHCSAAPDFFDRIRFGVLIPVVCALLLVFNIITLAIKYKNTDDGDARKNELIQALRSEYDSITGNQSQGTGETVEYGN